MDEIIGWPTCLPTYLPTYLGALCPGRPIAKAGELVMCLGRVALEEGLKGVVGYFRLDTFKIKLTLAGFSKLPSLAFSISITTRQERPAVVE